MKEKADFTIYTDGGARGNPGPAAYGFVVYNKDLKLIYEEGKTIGINTNNVAEYTAILKALKYIEQNNPPAGKPTIQFFMDSMLAARQLSGEWKIKNENLRSLYHTIKTLETRIGGNVSYTHVRREKNTEADRMVNIALDGLF